MVMEVVGQWAAVHYVVLQLREEELHLWSGLAMAILEFLQLSVAVDLLHSILIAQLVSLMEVVVGAVELVEL